MTQWAKSPKEKQSEGVRFFNSAINNQNTVPYCQKYTPTDCDIVSFSIY